MMDLKQEMKERCAYIEQALEQAVPEQKDFPPVIFEAMRYSLLAGGKRCLLYTSPSPRDRG